MTQISLIDEEIYKEKQLLAKSQEKISKLKEKKEVLLSQPQLIVDNLYDNVKKMIERLKTISSYKPPFNSFYNLTIYTSNITTEDDPYHHKTNFNIVSMREYYTFYSESKDIFLTDEETFTLKTLRITFRKDHENFWN